MATPLPLGHQRPSLREHILAVNGVRLHVVVGGAGPLVVLLHGFPEHWWSWRHQIAALSDSWTVAAPDLRGFNLSTSGDRRDIDTLVADVLGLIAALGFGTAALVGHDWGGAIAWVAAARHPERITRLAALNIPHPTIFGRALRPGSPTWSPAQMLRSAYIGLFQLPWLPERLLRAGDFALLIHQLRRDSAPGAFSAADLARYRAALRRTDMRAAVGLYRQRRPSRSGLTRPLAVHVPTLHIWGEQDRYLGRELLAGTAALVPDYTLRTIAWASHWVQNDAPEQVNAWLRPFLAGQPVPD